MVCRWHKKTPDTALGVFCSNAPSRDDNRSISLSAHRDNYVGEAVCAWNTSSPEAMQLWVCAYACDAPALFCYSASGRARTMN